MAEWNAGGYFRQSSLQAALAEEQLARLPLEGSEHVLDVGCGDGKITEEIAARLPRGAVLGVDRSQNMIDFARSHFGPPACANLRFEVADVRSLTYRGEFDRVVSFNALHWVPDQAAALQSIHAALKAAGKAFLRLVPQGPRQSLEDVIDEACFSPR
jgi:trans-aconitate 2-methyltransferase